MPYWRRKIFYRRRKKATPDKCLPISTPALPLSKTAPVSAGTTSAGSVASYPIPAPGRNPGPAFEKWVEVNWDTIVAECKGCSTCTLPKSINPCSSDWFDLSVPPNLTRNVGPNPTPGTPFGKCDFTDVAPATTPSPQPPASVFIECKATNKTNEVSLSARCYDLFKAAIKHKRHPWVVICRDYQWNPPFPPAGTIPTEFQPNQVIIIGPDVLGALITLSPPSLVSTTSSSVCCVINDGSGPLTANFDIINHPVGGIPSACTASHPTKVEIFQ